LVSDALLLQFGTERQRAMERYQDFVAQGRGVEIWRDLKQQIYLGDAQFLEKHSQASARQDTKLSEIPLKQRRKPAKSLEEYQADHSHAPEAMVAAYQSGGFTMQEIAQYFGCHYSTVSRVLAKGNILTVFDRA
jgi:hypothetical protein